MKENNDAQSNDVHGCTNPRPVDTTGTKPPMAPVRHSDSILPVGGIKLGRKQEDYLLEVAREEHLNRKMGG